VDGSASGRATTKGARTALSACFEPLFFGLADKAVRTPRKSSRSLREARSGFWGVCVETSIVGSARLRSAMANQIKLKALDDPDLEPLWAETGEI